MPGFLRFPAINRTLWYRVIALLWTRGELSEPERRFCRFISYQRIGSRSGIIVGRRGYEKRDGGMDLAERYSAVYGLAPDAFWVDLRRVMRRGLVEQRVKPAPHRKAVYALVLRYDAIPHSLPEDLARPLGVHDLPDIEDPHADASYGRLTDTPAPRMADPEPLELKQDKQPDALAAEMAAAPRWEHPANSPAALAAAAIARTSRTVPEEARPDLRCTAVAAPESNIGQRLAAHFGTEPETSPYTAKDFFPSGSSPDRSKWLGSSNKMEGQKTTTTPSAAPGRQAPYGGGDDPRVVADRILRGAWHSWRAQLGRRKVILPSGRWTDGGEWHSESDRSGWADLHRAVMIALRRSTEGEISEVLTGNVGNVEDLGRLAGFRLWRLINAKRDAHGYGRRRTVRPAGHVQTWDEATGEARESYRNRTAAEPLPGMYDTRADMLRAKAERGIEQARRATEARRQAEAAEREALYARWNIKVPPMREPERAHQAAQQDAAPAGPRRASDQARAAALAAKAAHSDGGRTGRKRRTATGEDAARAQRERLAQRLAQRLQDGDDA
ncbi:hypothetical protein GCM10010353_59460 [Streptomyces chryseus]|nr:hypothetical protein GCM10010353_59460 [Streptomyces chryseus]